VEVKRAQEASETEAQERMSMVETYYVGFPSKREQNLYDV
jgi:hypothetical protein